MKRKLAFAVVLGWSFSVPSTVRGDTFHVPGDFANIKDALAAAVDGDTILVGPGTYVGRIDFTGKDVDLRSTDGPETTTIQSDGGPTVHIGPGGRIDGFSITDGTGDFGAGMVVMGTGTVIEGNIFRNNAQGGGGFGAAIGGNSSSPTIRGNAFRQNTCDGQFLSGVVSFVNSSSPRIENNIFEDNPCRAINLTLPVGNQPQIVNNTIVRNPTGIRLDRRISAAAQTYRNNILYDNQIGLEVDFGIEAFNPVWEHNLVFGNVVDYDGIASQTGLSGNISQDPLFVDEMSDYHLRPESPAIDAGSASGAPAEDFDGTPRPLDGNGDSVAAFDIGAFESLPPPTDFFTVTPCRLADTRNPISPSGGPALVAEATRDFPVTGLCGIPSAAKAVVVNLAVVEPDSGGHLRLFAAGSALPAASTISFVPGMTRSNNAIISVGAGGQIAIYCHMGSPLGQTHFVLDVFGYFE
jgi:serine protease